MESVRTHGGQLRSDAYPPFNQIPHGSSLPLLAGAVNDPFDFSKPTKKRVLLGCPARCTGRFPAKLRSSGNVIFGRGSFTRKSTEVFQHPFNAPSKRVQSYSSAILDRNPRKAGQDKHEEKNLAVAKVQVIVRERKPSMKDRQEQGSEGPLRTP